MSTVDSEAHLIPAEENLWFLMATLHGVPDANHRNIKENNRISWNRYHSSKLTHADRKKISGAISNYELTPFNDAEKKKFLADFKSRSGFEFQLYNDSWHFVDFSNTLIDKNVDFSGFIFISSSFNDSKFLTGCYFSGAVFINSANFYGTIFKCRAYFNNSHFFDVAMFATSNFLNQADFVSVNFYSWSSFDKCIFSKATDFKCSIFSRITSFKNCIIDDGINFEENIFKEVNFSGARFLSVSLFISCNFSEDSKFNNTEFVGESKFKYNSFKGSVDYSNSKFSGGASFSSSKFYKLVNFINVRFDGLTYFVETEFRTVPPVFYGATLHEGTIFRRISWPSKPIEKDNASDHAKAYARLKQEMDRLKMHEEELMFFAKEMECRELAEGWFRGVIIASYGLGCSYGQSFIRPFIWLVTLFNAGAPALFFLQPDLGWAKAVGLSAVNCLAGFGLGKELMGKTLESLGTGALIVSGVQMVLGLVFLFLIGLGLRNRFRMK